MKGSSAHVLLTLHLRAKGLPTPKHEFRFHPKRKWRFDMAWEKVLDAHPSCGGIAVEIDGGTYTGGRHVRGTGYAKDCEKLNAATELGWKVYRYTSEMVKRGEAIKQLERVLR